MSALPLKADINVWQWEVRLVPQADIPESDGSRQRDELIDVLFAGGVQRGTTFSRPSRWAEREVERAVKLIAH